MYSHEITYSFQNYSKLYSPIFNVESVMYMVSYIKRHVEHVVEIVSCKMSHTEYVRQSVSYKICHVEYVI